MEAKSLHNNAIGALILALGLIVLATVWGAVTGGQQEPFEHAKLGYSEMMLEVAEALRITLFLDFIFIVCFALGLGLTVLHWQGTAPALVAPTLIAIAMLALLDFAEDFALLGSLATVQMGEVVSLAQMQTQEFISGAKWMMTALAVVLITFFIPPTKLLNHIAIWGSRVGMVLGCAGFVAAPGGFAVVSKVLLYIGIICGFALLIVILFQERKAS